MQGWMLQERLAGIIKGYGVPVPDKLRLITPDCQPDFLANLATPEGQAALEPTLAGVELLILDNLATLCRVGKENEAESWLTVQAWLLSLRRRGMAVVVVHHANKNGGQRGTSSREDVMDTVIALLPVKGHSPADGTRFEVHLQKARGLAGSGAEPFVASLTAKDEAFHWTTHPLSENADKIVELYDQGKSVRDIEELTGIPKSTMQRILDKQLMLLVSIHAPAQGATLIGGYPRRRREVSIHAPARGATGLSRWPRCCLRFQSTPPRGGRP